MAALYFVFRPLRHTAWGSVSHFFYSKTESLFSQCFFLNLVAYSDCTCILHMTFHSKIEKQNTTISSFPVFIVKKKKNLNKILTIRLTNISGWDINLKDERFAYKENLNYGASGLHA